MERSHPAQPARSARCSSPPRAACRVSATVVPVERRLASGGSRIPCEERTVPGGWVGGQISDAKAFRGVGVQYATGIIEIGDDDDPCPSPPEVFLCPPPPPHVRRKA